MKVFDRYAGTEVSLPKVVTPGRYRLLKAATLNTGISLAQGDVLVSDGQELCALCGDLQSQRIGSICILKKAHPELGALCGDRNGLANNGSCSAQESKCGYNERPGFRVCH